MSQRKRKVANLINRFQFIDLALAVSKPSVDRKDWLRKYLNRAIAGGKFPSYRYFRRQIPTIYGVSRGLDISPKVGREDVEKYTRKACNGTDEDMNVEVALMLFDLVRPLEMDAWDHPERHLSLGLGKKAAIGLNTYLVNGEELIFQYPYPRREPLTKTQAELLLSIIHHAYAVDDFEGAAVEIAELSMAKHLGGDKTKKRQPFIWRLPPEDVISKPDLGNEVQDIFDLLLQLGAETGADDIT